MKQHGKDLPETLLLRIGCNGSLGKSLNWPSATMMMNDTQMNTLNFQRGLVPVCLKHASSGTIDTGGLWQEGSCGTSQPRVIHSSIADTSCSSSSSDSVQRGYWPRPEPSGVSGLWRSCHSHSNSPSGGLRNVFHTIGVTRMFHTRGSDSRFFWVIFALSKMNFWSELGKMNYQLPG